MLATAVLLDPSTAEACCADVEERSLVGWSAGGELLVEHTSSTDCAWTRTAEVLDPAGAVLERYDLHRRGRRIASDAVARELNDEDLYEAEESGRRTTWAPPRRVRAAHRLAVTSLCADALSAEAFPAGSTEAGRELVDVRVAVRIDGTTHPIASLKISRWFATEASITVYPTPRGDQAVLSLGVDGPDYVGNELHYISLPAGAVTSQVPRECEHAIRIVPSPELPMGEGGLANAKYYHEEAEREAREAATSGDSSRASWVLETYRQAIWADPRNDALRRVASRWERVVAGELPLAAMLPEPAGTATR